MTGAAGGKGAAGPQNALVVGLNRSIIGKNNAGGGGRTRGEQLVIITVDIGGVSAHGEEDPVAGGGVVRGPVEGHSHPAGRRDVGAAGTGGPVPQFGGVANGVEAHGPGIAGAIAAGGDQFELIAADLLLHGGGLGQDAAGGNAVGPAGQAGRVQIAIGDVVVVREYDGLGAGGGEARQQQAGGGDHGKTRPGDFFLDVFHGIMFIYMHVDAPLVWMAQLNG